MGASGIADLDFGAVPGGNHATLAITGQGGIVPGSLVEAWVHPTVDTADHTIDEHIIMVGSGLQATASHIVNGVGFTINLLFTPIMQDPTYDPVEGPGVGRTTSGVYKVAWVWV